MEICEFCEAFVGQSSHQTEGEVPQAGHEDKIQRKAMYKRSESLDTYEEHWGENELYD